MTDEPRTSAENVSTGETEIAQYQVLGDLVPGIVIICNCETLQIEYANGAFYRELNNRFSSLGEFLSPLELKKVKHAIRFCMENEREEKATISFDPYSEKAHLVRFKPVGDCSILLLATSEILPSGHFEQKEILALIGNISETAAYGMWVFDLDLRKATWSEGMYHLLEIEREKYQHLVAEDAELYHRFIEPSDLPVVNENYRKLLADGDDVDMVYSIITGKGNRKKIHTSIKVLEKNANGLSKCIGINRDISAPTQLSELLLRQASEIALKEKMLMFGTWQYDVLSGQLEWSDGIYWLFGYDPYVERKTLRLDIDFLTRHIDALGENWLADLLAKLGALQKDIFEYSAGVRKKNGDRRKIESQIRVFRNKEGKPVKIYGTSRDITEKDQLMEELISYKQMVQEKEEFLGQGSFEYDLLTGNYFISEGLLKIYGINKAEANDLTLRGLFKTCFEPEEQKRVYSLFKELSVSGGAREIEVSAMVNGERKDLEVYAKVFKSVSGKTERIVGTTKDITAIKALYNELLRFKEDLSERELLLKHGTWQYDLTTGRYSLSDGLFEVFGVKNSLENFRMEDYFLPEELGKANATRHEVLEKGSAYIDGLGIRTAGGELKYIEMFSKLILDKKGDRERIIGIIRDVSRLQSFKKELKDQVMRGDVMNQELTDAKRKLEIKLTELEKANQELELYKQTMLDKDEFLNQGTWEWDLKSGRMDYSRGIYRLFGYHDKDEMAEWDKAGKDTGLHMDEKERKRNAEDWTKILAEADTYLREMEVTTKDGFRRKMETFGKVFRDENGEAYKVIGTTRDITKLKEYEQELEVKINELNRSNKDLEEFAYIASHDLHEPLRKLSTFGQRLGASADQELSPANKDYLDRMLKATDNMRNLIDNLLEFSRVTRSAATFVKTDLNHLITEVLNEQELRIEETNAEVIVDKMPELEIVPSQMKQLFNNLLSNALKFIRPDAKPVIAFRCTRLLPEEILKYKLIQNREYVKIGVEDNGIGFDRMYADKIFQIFQRLHGKSEYSGSGIGLAICRKIVDNHKGLIFAESEPGKGSLFTIILPIKP
ncbi:MAG TPA: PAS domain S-box protein [Chitinophagaceae bacterium]|nr:PAS domain S-box protein [Chitinophagaceae bacterium]